MVVICLPSSYPFNPPKVSGCYLFTIILPLQSSQGKWLLSWYYWLPSCLYRYLEWTWLAIGWLQRKDLNQYPLPYSWHSVIYSNWDFIPVEAFWYINILVENISCRSIWWNYRQIGTYWLQWKFSLVCVLVWYHGILSFELMISSRSILELPYTIQILEKMEPYV